jgi:SAM-dependent methyltransferase
MAKQPEFVSDFSQTGQVPDEGRLDAPAFHRNHLAIWSVIAPHLDGRRGEVLEVGSGTGQHVALFARQSPRVTWLPSDHLDAHLESIAGWSRKSGLSNIAPPQRVDLLDPGWGANFGRDRFLAILCINVLHISPWTTSENLLAQSARLLRRDGRLFIYGAFNATGATPPRATTNSTRACGQKTSHGVCATPPNSRASPRERAWCSTTLRKCPRTISRLSSHGDKCRA